MSISKAVGGKPSLKQRHRHAHHQLTKGAQ